MLCGALKQANCLRGVVVVRVVVRPVGVKRSVRCESYREVIVAVRGVLGRRFLVVMILLSTIVFVIVTVRSMLMMMPVAVMAFVGWMMIAEITLVVRPAGRR
jgi:hypothetical protein